MEVFHLTLSKVTAPATRLIYESDYSPEDRYICLVDDDKETFKVQEQEFAPFVVSPLLKNYASLVVGVCHGLICLYGLHKGYNEDMVVIWNHSIGKSFGVAAHIDYSFVFGVCPVTRDPTVVKLKQRIGMPWHVEVFTLSSGVWDVIPSSNSPHESVRIDLFTSTQVVIDRFIYWAAYDDGVTLKRIVVSFDLITKEFKVIDLPNSLTEELYLSFSVSKLRESLVVYGSKVEGAGGCDVWVMEHGSSFRKLFTIGTTVDNIVGFKKNGETIFETSKESGVSAVRVYDPCSQQIKNLGIYVREGSFFIGAYKESLLLLDHLDSHIY